MNQMKKLLWGVLIGFFVAAFGGVILLCGAAWLASRPPRIPGGSVLVLNWQGSIPETPGFDIPFPMFDRWSAPTVRDHWETLRKAAADSRIRGIVLMPDGIQAGWAKLQELRNDTVSFRKSGKPVYAFLRSPGAREYYLASACDRVYISSEDELDLKGMRIEMVYLKKTLDKLGIQAEFEHAGKYKSAPEIFTRSSMSPESREVMTSILDDMYGQLVNTLAEARHKTPDQMRAIVDQGPFTAQQAVAAGLVDGLRYSDQVFGEMQKQLHLSETHKVAARDYMRVPAESLGLETGKQIALVVGEGDIVRGDAGDSASGQGEISAAAMTKLLRRVREDGGIKGVIVRIDSGGGDAFASDEIWREMALLSKAKPVVISMSDLAASGGYYIAATGDPIVAYPATLTGSIGVFFGKVNLHGLYDKLGIEKDILSRGRFAEIDSDYTPLSDDARRKLQVGLDAFYKSFVTKVAESRHRSYEQVAPLAEGRVWLGDQAKGNGLVDEMGGLDRAIEMVKRRAGIPAREQVKLVSYPPKRPLLEELFGREDDWTDLPATAFLRRFHTKLWMRGGIMRMMPYSIEFR
jgi:protease-4